MSMDVTDLRQRLIAIEAWAGELKRTGAAADSPTVKKALDLYDSSMKVAIRDMLKAIDASPTGQVDLGAMVKKLDGKIDEFLKIAARCPAMSMFQPAAGGGGAAQKTPEVGP